MITPILYNLHNTVDDWGNDINDFWIVMEATIGPENEEEGGDLFTFNIVSPKRLLRIIEEESIVIGRGFLILLDYNINTIKKTIKDILNGIKGETWTEVANKICRYAKWEYEGYEGRD